MFNICIDSPIPSLKKLKEEFIEQLNSIKDRIPNFSEFIESLLNISIPKLMGLPDPLFADYSNILKEIMEIIDAIKLEADYMTMLNMFYPLIKVLGVALEDIIPKIPVLNFSIIDLINGKINDLYEAVKDCLAKGIKLPFLPDNIFESLSNYTKEAAFALKMILVGYKELLIETLTGVIEQVLDILDISAALPVLPKIPTVQELKDMILAAFPDYKSWFDLLNNVSLDKILAIFGLPDIYLPEIGALPCFSNFEEYLMDVLNQIKDYITSQGIQLLVDFVNDVLGMLGFSFPLFCVEF